MSFERCDMMTFSSFFCLSEKRNHTVWKTSSTETWHMCSFLFVMKISCHALNFLKSQKLTTIKDRMCSGLFYINLPVKRRWMKGPWISVQPTICLSAKQCTSLSFLPNMNGNLQNLFKVTVEKSTSAFVSDR